MSRWEVVNLSRGNSGGAGPQGQSAYQVAVDNGFVGTESDWLASLVGAPGEDGENGTNGTNGTNGVNGINGAAATIAVGTTTTGSPGSSASVTNSGTSSAAVFNFTVPRGDTGATGPAGPSVVTPVAARSAAYSTAYQTSSLTKPSFISAVIDVTHSVALAGTQQDVVELRVGTNQTQVANGSGGSIAASWRAQLTAILTLVGAGVGQRGQIVAMVPAGYYWALRRTTGTQATINQVTEQEIG